MNGWFLSLILLYVLSLGVNLAKHGELKTGKYNFFASLFWFVVEIALIYKAIHAG